MSKRASSSSSASAAAIAKKIKQVDGSSVDSTVASSFGAAHSGPSSHAHHGPLSMLASANIRYQPGLGNEHHSEAMPNALPNQNSPQLCPYGLYAEQLSGSSFTTPRKENQKAWFYRIRPAAAHPPFATIDIESGGLPLASPLLVSDFASAHVTPNQFRWRPFSMETLTKAAKVDFIQGIATLAGTGAPDTKTGMAIHIYTCNTSMGDKGFVNSDGDMLIVPQQGTLHVRTEFGMLCVPSGQICVVQRGIMFSVGVEGESRGYICEVFNGHFKLPDLGPIGANGLAAPRDFMHPTAEFEDRQCEFVVVQKFIGRFFSYTRTHSPYDVVAWYGNYVPYVYDLAKFCPVGAVRSDHMDPSIFTVLTCATAEVGVACCDFVIFPPRWAVQEHTFRPPYYHKNCMSEFMGNIMGKYEAKPDGFLPGGASLHSCMVSHGPDAATFDKASTETLQPMRLPDNSLSFMFESTYMFKLTDWALKVATPDADYWKVWEPIQSKFEPNWKPTGNEKGANETTEACN